MSERGSKSITIGKRLLAEEVFHHIATQIIEGELEPGHRIRDIDVADELHVSRTPVREALQRLERLGLVTMYPSRYTEVTAVTPELVDQTLEFAGYQAGTAAHMSVPRMSASERSRAAELVGDLISAVDDSTRTSEARWAVFSYLSEHSGNDQYRALVSESGMALFRNLHDWTVPVDDQARMRQLYLGLQRAILDGDADEAERCARAMHYI